MTITCRVCGKQVEIPNWRAKLTPKYCSYECRNRGRGVTAETRAKMSAAQQARGPRSDTTKARMKVAQQMRAQVGGRRSKTSSYRRWRNMLNRCYRPDDVSFPYYGGRGITVCSTWIESYEQFLLDVGLPPTPQHSLDRINNDGHYEPGNVRWATASEQNHNRRPRKSR